MTASSATSNPGSLKLFNACQKTKMCRFYAVGTCTKQGQCRFAHSADELQPAPDLRRTKICPELVKTGSCDNQECIFAHSKDGVRKLNLCRIINSLKKKRGGTIWKSTKASARDDHIDPALYAVGISNAVNHNVNVHTTNVNSTMMWSPSPPPPFPNPMAPPASPKGDLVVENTFITFKEPREKGARVRSHSWSHCFRPQGLLLGSDAGQNEGFVRAVSHGFPQPSAFSPVQASCGTCRGSQGKYRESFRYKSAPLLTRLEVTPEADEPHESLSTPETTPTATTKEEAHEGQGLALRDHRPMDVLPRKLPRGAGGPSPAAPQNIGRQCGVQQFGAGGSGSAWK